MPDSFPEGRPFDFIAMGRAAVDLYGEQIGGRLEDMQSFAKYLGGCPANISVGAARLGLRPAMLTRVGDEHMGRFVRETLAAEGVDVSHVKTDPKRLTGLVILGIRDHDTFPLIFVRTDCADMAIAPDDFDAEFISKAKALVVTGTHFSRPDIDNTCRTAIRHAKAAGTKVVLDIDYRPVLWGLTSPGAGENRFVASSNVSEHIQTIVPHCDLIVGTEEEVHIAGGSTDTLTALRRLRELSKATIVLKRGPQGCAVFPGLIPNRIDDGILGPGFPVEVFNVLGAGDGFMAGLLRGWLRGADWPEACRIANACGALVVSRHACAPAMPSWTELSDFLERAKKADGPTKLHEDPRVAYLHRVTTGRKPWPQVAALAFDHRWQFEELAKKHGKGPEQISRYKSLVAEAAKRVGQGVDGAGIILDDKFGRDALYASTGRNLWIARPVELPRSIPVEYEHGPDIIQTLRAWPQEHIVKVLIFYQPDDPVEIKAAHEKRMRELQRACHATGHEFLLEVIPPRVKPGEGADLIIDSVARFYEVGVMPDWWKLPPLPDAGAWKRLGDIVRKNDPHCRGIIILGQEVSDNELRLAFDAAANEKLVRGFAIGRTIFWGPAEQWFAGQIDDETAVKRVAENYVRVAALWRDRKRAT
ncbi:MAG: 5-dehydro-2-deoxygluconokinase [Alphaproteobacteria bacterium]|nr:5-dehydro-2-deoxygluconokinase [Alphaproteobacteria bacterium]